MLLSTIKFILIHNVYLGVDQYEPAVDYVLVVFHFCETISVLLTALFAWYLKTS